MKVFLTLALAACLLAPASYATASSGRTSVTHLALDTGPAPDIADIAIAHGQSASMTADVVEHGEALLEESHQRQSPVDTGQAFAPASIETVDCVDHRPGRDNAYDQSSRPTMAFDRVDRRHPFGVQGPALAYESSPRILVGYRGHPVLLEHTGAPSRRSVSAIS